MWCAPYAYKQRGSLGCGGADQVCCCCRRCCCCYRCCWMDAAAGSPQGRSARWRPFMCFSRSPPHPHTPALTRSGALCPAAPFRPRPGLLAAGAFTARQAAVLQQAGPGRSRPWPASSCQAHQNTPCPLHPTTPLAGRPVLPQHHRRHPLHQGTLLPAGARAAQGSGHLGRACPARQLPELWPHTAAERLAAALAPPSCREARSHSGARWAPPAPRAPSSRRSRPRAWGQTCCSLACWP